MTEIEVLLEQFQNEQAAQIENFKAVLEIVKAQDRKIKELTKERDAAIANIHAHWIETGEKDGDNNKEYRCSNCNHGDMHSPSIEVPYCWYCGARMDGAE